MLRQDHVQTLRQTHRTVTTVLPLVTAALTVTGAIIASMEPRSAQGQPNRDSDGSANGDASHREEQSFATDFTTRHEAGLSVVAYLLTLISRALLVALGIALVLALILLATRVGPTGIAIELTALILVALYLTEKVARRQASRVRRA